MASTTKSVLTDSQSGEDMTGKPASVSGFNLDIEGDTSASEQAALERRIL